MNNQKHYKVCFHCGNFVHESSTDNYCTVCGNELKARCHVCDTKLSNPYAKYCSNCGTSFIQQQAKEKK